MNRKLIILVVGVVAVVAIVAVFVVPLLLGPLGPPFNVYARPTPLISEEPLDLLPNQVAGFNLLSSELGNPPGALKGALGIYDEGITVAIGRWSSAGAAASGLELLMTSSLDSADVFASANAGEQHWFTATRPGESVFAWRKGVWVFAVIAPDEALRNQVVEDLPF